MKNAHDCCFESITELSSIGEVTYTDDHLEPNVLGYIETIPKEINLNTSLNCSLMKSLSGGKRDDRTHIEFGVPVILPVKRHRKKRIQKKWIKKYGVTLKYINVSAEVRAAVTTPKSVGCIECELTVKEPQIQGINKIKGLVSEQCQRYAEQELVKDIGGWI